MSYDISLTIKDYHNRGGNLTLKLRGAQYSEAAANSGRVQLIANRQPDQHSSRLGMFAFLRNTQPGYQNIGFSEMMLTIRDDTEAVVSLMINVFFNVWVESVKPYGPGA